MSINDTRIGAKMYDESIKSYHNSDKVLNGLDKALKKLNQWASGEANKLYLYVFKSLELNGVFVENTVNNLSKVSLLTNGLEPILSGYRYQYGEIFRTFREDLLAVAIDKEERAEKILGNIGVEDSRSELTEESFKIVSVLTDKNFRAISNMLDNWKNKVYDLFISGVSKSLDLVSFRSLFYNSDGTVKVGSSLEEISTTEAMKSAVEAKTAFSMAKAKELGYTYCWNVNPMDRRTKPECMAASLAGVIPEGEMGSVYGFPPRFICRCDIQYTKPEWVGVNRGINEAIAEKRIKVIEELLAAPRQKGSWKWKGMTVLSNNPELLAGSKMYKDIEEKLSVAMKNKVPEFDAVAGVESIWAKGASKEQVEAFMKKYGITDVSDTRVKFFIDECFQ